MWERSSSSISCSWRERFVKPLTSDFKRGSMSATPRVPRRMIYQPLLDSQGEECKKNISRRDVENKKAESQKKRGKLKKGDSLHVSRSKCVDVSGILYGKHAGVPPFWFRRL